MAAEKAEKPGLFKRIGRWFKELGSELKKVSWPNAKTVIKQTGVVLGVTIFFLAIVIILDVGLSQLYRLLIRGDTSPGPVPEWVSSSFPGIRLALMIVMVVMSGAMIFFVFTQSAASEGLGAISGGQDTFFGKNKGKTIEGTMKRLTVVTAISLVVVAILFFVSLMIYTGALQSQ